MTDHVHGLGDVGEEVSDAPILLDVVLGVGLERMHHVRELYAVADEENLLHSKHVTRDTCICNR